MNSKAQAWYMDFAVGLLMFTFTLVVYFSYTNNFQKQGKSDLDLMITDAKAISSSLALSGYPSDWNNTTVIRIGIADEQNINPAKIKAFRQLNYTRTKSSFATPYDYVVFFVNDKGEVLNINGLCVTGIPVVNTTYNVRSAYYYQDNSVDFKLRDFMNETFKADIYFKSNTNDIYGLYGLIKNISKYGFIVMEHPLLNGGDYNNVKDALNNYSSRGGAFMISGELVTGQDKELVGVTFSKKSGQSTSDRNSTVNATDKYLTLTPGENIVFRQAYYIENDTSSATPALGLATIASFNEDNKIAIAKWKYGNGTVYFFSDFDVSNFNGNFVKAVEESAKGIIEGTCNPINLTSLNIKNLAKTERYLNYNSKIVKMVVYVWQ